METFELNLYVILYGIMWLLIMLGIFSLLIQAFGAIADSITKNMYEINLKPSAVVFVLVILLNCILFYIKNH